MKRKAFLTGLVVFLIIGSLIATRSTDGYFAAASIAFFVLCIAYTMWCERL
jgi:hypothetical protein